MAMLHTKQYQFNCGTEFIVFIGKFPLSLSVSWHWINGHVFPVPCSFFVPGLILFLSTRSTFHELAAFNAKINQGLNTDNSDWAFTEGGWAPHVTIKMEENLRWRKFSSLWWNLPSLKAGLLVQVVIWTSLNLTKRQWIWQRKPWMCSCASAAVNLGWRHGLASLWTTCCFEGSGGRQGVDALFEQCWW